MIQRIQTLWLMISTLAPLYLVKGAIGKFTSAGQEYYRIGFRGIELHNGAKMEIIQSSVAIPAMVILISVISLIAVALYKNRKIQRVLVLIAFTISAGLLLLTVYHTWQITGEFNAGIRFVPGLLVPPLLCLTTLLAFRGISRDEEIVRSYDRLR